MEARHRVTAWSAAALIVGLFGLPASAERGAPVEHWVATWASAQQTGRGAGRAAVPAAVPPGGGPPAAPPIGGAPAAIAPLPPVASAPPVVAPAGSPSGVAGPSPAPFAGFTNQTVRMVIRTSLGGHRFRIHFSNAFGTTPLVLRAAHVALSSHDSEIVAGSDHALTFNAWPGVTIPVGAEMVSDPVDLDVPALTPLAVSVYVPGPTGPLSGHSLALQTTYVSREGDATYAQSLADGTTTQAWYWVSEVDVVAPPKAAAIVTFGDSITDGATSTPGTNRSWPSRLAERLVANRSTSQVAIVNEGISGNRVLADGAGVSALARFDRDVLGVAGVQWLMILEGINDIGAIQRGTPLDADTLIGAVKQLADRAHTHGIKVIGCTLTPYGGAGYATDIGEAIRVRYNTFIRTDPIFDAVVDFEAVARDPANPTQFKPGFNTTDHLHPNDTGYKAMADAIDLGLFTIK